MDSDPHTLTGLADTQAEAHAAMVAEVTEGREVSEEEERDEAAARIAYYSEPVSITLPRVEWYQMAKLLTEGTASRQSAANDLICRVREWDDDQRRKQRRERT